MTDTAGELAASTRQDIDRFLDDHLFDADVPGASVAVFDRDGVQYATGYGSRDREENAPATADTLYYVGSITKLVTAVAVLQLVDRGALALDDAVGQYVDFLADVPGEPVTVEDLLTHSSGMPADAIVGRDTIADERDLALHVDGATDRRLTDRERFFYYNSGYKVLGALVEAVDGRDYEPYVQDAVFDPLGMERSTFDQSVLEASEDGMTGYVREDEELERREEPLDFEGVPADGGLVAPVAELTRLLRCLLAGGELDGERILGADLADAMTSRQTAWTRSIDGTERWYGYGSIVRPFGDDTVVGHAGAVWTAQANLIALADRGLGVALAVNAGHAPAIDFARGVLALVAGEDPTRTVPALGLDAKIDTVTGTYESYRDGPTVEVSDAGGYVELDLDTPDEVVAAFPESSAPDEYEFYTVDERGTRAPVEFLDGDNGLVLLWERHRYDRV